MIWFTQETWPFGSALMLMLALFFIEGAGLIFSISPSGWIDGFTPDGAEGSLGWLHLGKVPFLILLGIFLAGFALSGYLIQGLTQALLGELLPAWLASLPSIPAGLTLVSSLGGLIARVMPSDETSAVSEQSFIGRAGVVTQGIARQGMAAQAKVRDIHGRTHYVMVEPDLAGDTLEEGVAVLLVKKTGAMYRCIRNPHPVLL